MYLSDLNKTTRSEGNIKIKEGKSEYATSFRNYSVAILYKGRGILLMSMYYFCNVKLFMFIICVNVPYYIVNDETINFN